MHSVDNHFVGHKFGRHTLEFVRRSSRLFPLLHSRGRLWAGSVIRHELFMEESFCFRCVAFLISN